MAGIFTDASPIPQNGKVKTAEIVSVGTELLLGQIIDTHAPTMARVLAECGIACQRRATIGDNFDRLVASLKESLSRADILVTIGGLGPTMDDLTRDAIAAALGDELVRDAGYEAELRGWFEKRNYPFAESNARQADVPASGRMIENPNGTAPGLLCQKNGKVVVALPGPKGEFNPMAFGPVKTFFETLGGGVIHSRTLRVIGIGESAVEEMVAEVMGSENPTVAPYAHTGEVHLRVTARAANVAEAEALIEPVQARIAAILGNHLFGTNETTLEENVLELLAQRGETISVAESMTGGQLGARLTGVPGASRGFLGGVVAYAAGAKTALLGVSPETLAAHGPVSGETAIEMAEGARRAFGSTFSVAITGNAGPGVEPGGKPVGKTFLAFASPEGTRVEEFQYRGIREDIQRRATQTALTMLRETILAD